MLKSGIQTEKIMEKEKMFKKLLTAVMIVVFAGSAVAFAGSADAKISQKKVKVDHSSKRALVRSYVEAIKAKDADAIWECCSEPTRKQMDELCKRINPDLTQAKKMFVESGHKLMAEELKKHDSMEKFIDTGVKEMEKENVFVNVNGKWYLQFQ